jgi:type VI secretion system protein ImpG
VRDRRGASLVDGVEVRLCIDEEGFVGTGIHLFAQVVARYLGLSVQVNSFAELVIVSATSGEELLRCPPCNGDLQLA